MVKSLEVKKNFSDQVNKTLSVDPEYSKNGKPVPNSVYVFIGEGEPSEYEYGTLTVPIEGARINVPVLTEKIADWLETVEGKTEERFYGVDDWDDNDDDYLHISYVNRKSDVTLLAVIRGDELDSFFKRKKGEFKRGKLNIFLSDKLNRDKEAEIGLLFNR